MIKAALLKVLKSVLIATLSEAVLKKLIIELMREGAKRTAWDKDDEIVEEIAKALNVSRETLEK